MPTSLLKELQASKVVDEYIVSMRNRKVLRRPLTRGHALQRHEGRVLEAKIFIDRGLGRGHSHFFVPPDAQTRTLIKQSASRALGALGPSWRLEPPSAPARLELQDQAWADDLEKSLDQLTEEFHKQLPKTLTLLQGSIEVELVDARSILSNGFDNHFGSTRARISARLQAQKGAPVLMEIDVRRRKDLRLQKSFARAERSSLERASQIANVAGECDLLLMSTAYWPQAESDFGIWNPLAKQCSAALAAEGMAKYRVGQAILPNPAQADPLTIRSDGTRNFGLRSAPFDSDGQAVRRFSIVDKGRAAGQSVNYREAARQEINANGGVRDLIVESGKVALAELKTPGERPLLVVHRLSDLHAEARGGLLLRVDSSEIRERDPAGATQIKATGGGVLCGNLYTWLQDARFSRERQNLHWFEGPKAIRFNNLRLQA